MSDGQIPRLSSLLVAQRLECFRMGVDLSGVVIKTATVSPLELEYFQKNSMTRTTPMTQFTQCPNVMPTSVQPTPQSVLPTRTIPQGLAATQWTPPAQPAPQQPFLAGLRPLQNDPRVNQDVLRQIQAKLDGVY